MKRRELSAEISQVLGEGDFHVDVEVLALLYVLIVELRGLRADLVEWRSATSNSSKTDRQLEAEAHVGMTLEEFFSAHADASVGDLATALGVSKSTAHAWRQAWGGGE